MASPSLTGTLATILCRPVTHADRLRACSHLLDWIGCAFAALPSAQGKILHQWARTAGDVGSHPVIGGGMRTREAALFVNGGLGNVLEMDDLHRVAVLHPGPVVVPTVLAVAAQSDCSGGQLLDAIVRGYEAMIRVGRSFGKGHYRYWHNTATAGPFGAAAATCSMLNADSSAIVDALGHAGTQSAGLWQTRHEASMSKQLHTGRAAHAGLIGAELAINGFTAPHYILEGPQGLYAAMCPDALPDQVLSQPDGNWLIHEVSFKPWPACRHAHAAIDAALIARQHHRPDQIRCALVRTYDEAIRFCDSPHPQTPDAARFSLQHSVAVCLARGEPELADFEPAALIDESLQTLAQRTAVQLDNQIDARFPWHYGAALDLTLNDGSMVSYDVPDALGDPDKPISAGQRESKVRKLLHWSGLNPADANRLMDSTMKLVNAQSVAPLLQLLASSRVANQTEQLT